MNDLPFDSRNHLIIGLGGTGGKVIRAMRKKVFEQFRSHHPPTANLDYLYIDSSDELMHPNDPSWKILGTSVQLLEKNRVHLTDSSLREVVENTNNYPGIRPWIGSRDQLRDTLGSDQSVKIFGGQRRRLGRFLFAQRIREFNDKVQGLLNDLGERSREHKATIHICAGLAGGTGSGSIIDAVAQVRRAYTDPKSHRIIVYVLLPEEKPKPGWNAGNYHANGYAALLELNALVEQRWRPHDVSGQAARLPGSDGRLELNDAFVGCYVFTDTNEHGQVREVATEVPETLASFLYQKTVVLTNPSENPLRRFEDFENYPGGGAELQDGTSVPIRSRRFFTFGIKQLSYPEEEIREYLTFEFVRQAAAQLVHNNWSDEFGYLEESRPGDFGEQVRDKARLGRWKLTEDHLTLNLGILPEEIERKGRVPFAQEWEAVITQLRVKEFGTPLKEKVAVRHDSLDSLKRELAHYLDGGFRQMGVKSFFQQKARACDEHASEIVGVVERELLQDWRAGERSADEVGRLVEALLEYTKERRRDADDRISRLIERDKSIAQVMLKNDHEWAKVGMLGKQMGKLNDIYNLQSTHLLELVIARTQVEAWQFGKVLLARVAARLEVLHGQLGHLKARFAEAGGQAAEVVRSRLTGQGRMDVRLPVVRYYDDELVRDFARRLVRDEKVQQAQTRAVRERLTGLAGKSPTFEKLLEELPVTRIVDVMSEACDERVRDAHAEMQSGKRRLLGVSVLGKLADEYGNDEEKLLGLTRRLAGAAADFVKFNNAEATRTGDGCEVWPDAARGFAVVYPADRQHEEFRDRLVAAFHASTSAQQKLGAEYHLQRDGSPLQHEITLLTFSNCLPLRYIEQVKLLRAEYLARINGPEGERARYQVHTEGDGSHLPDLFPIDPAVRRSQALQWLFLAQPLGLVQKIRQDGMAERLYIIQKDADGFDADPVELGKDEIAASEQMPSSTLYVLQDQVRTMIRPRALDETRRSEIADWLRQQAEERKATLGMLSEEYKQVNAAIRAAYAELVAKE
jgi:hypothetical protein